MCSKKRDNPKKSNNSIIDIIPFNEIIEIKVITKASENKIYLDNDLIKVKTTAVPENGQANKTIIELFSKFLKIPKKNIEIVSGFTNSIKRIILRKQQDIQIN